MQHVARMLRYNAAVSNVFAAKSRLKSSQRTSCLAPVPVSGQLFLDAKFHIVALVVSNKVLFLSKSWVKYPHKHRPCLTCMPAHHNASQCVATAEGVLLMATTEVLALFKLSQAETKSHMSHKQCLRSTVSQALSHKQIQSLVSMRAQHNAGLTAWLKSCVADVLTTGIASLE